jgi:hypothetical protein
MRIKGIELYILNDYVKYKIILYIEIKMKREKAFENIQRSVIFCDYRANKIIHIYYNIQNICYG